MSQVNKKKLLYKILGGALIIIPVIIFLNIDPFIDEIQKQGKDKPSRTAEGVAALRAIAAHDKDEKIRGPDYLAEKFIAKGFRESSIWFSWYDPDNFQMIIKAMHDRKSVGYFYLNARTKHIDTTLINQYTRGIKQVVILGSGYDSRVHRFSEKMPGVKFFEVDLPATITEKKKRVIKIFGKLPEQAVYAPIDFNVDTIENVLKNVGYNPKLKTFFIWEGVTMYISKEAVNGTLTFIAEHSASGSSVIFDYIHRDLIDGEFENHLGSEAMTERVADLGEPFTFGLAEDEAAECIKKNKLKVISDIGKKEMIKYYLIKSNGEVDGDPSTIFRLMHAGV